MAKKLEEIKEEECPYELPEGWKWVRLGNIAKTQYGYTESATSENVGPKFLRITDIQNGKVEWEKVPYCTISESDFLKYKLHVGNIVVARTGATTGKSYIVCDDVEAVYASYLIGVSINHDFTNDRFVYDYMQSVYYWTQITSFSQGIAQPGVNGKKLQELLLPLPPKEHQQKIVDIIESLFAKLDIAQEKVEQVLAESENRRSAILHNAFSGKLTEKWREENNVSFDSWNEGILKNVLDVRDGTHDSPAFQEEGYPLITSKNLKNEKIILNDIKFISKDDYDKINQRSKVEIGDILFAMIGTIGNPVVVDSEPNYAIKNVALLKSINKINPYFVKYYLLSAYVKNKMIKEAKGSTQKFVSLGYLRSFPIVIPLLKEQQEIVRLLDKFLSVEDKVKSTCQSTLEAIATMRKSILAKSFRGELFS